jgi:hypothetical protein
MLSNYQHGIIQKPGMVKVQLMALVVLLKEQRTGWFHKEMTLLMLVQNC